MASCDNILIVDQSPAYGLLPSAKKHVTHICFVKKKKKKSWGNVLVGTV